MKMNMHKTLIIFAVTLLLPAVLLYSETFRTVVDGTVEVSSERPSGSPVSLGINSSVIINLVSDTRFLRGIEIEISAPQGWLIHRNSLVMAMYNNLTPKTAAGVTDITGTQIAFEPLPSRLQIVYQVPIRQGHGLRTTTSVTVPAGITLPSTFPILFRLQPVIKGLTDDIENMKFNLVIRPVLGDEGAVRLVHRYPAQLRNRPFTVLIDDNVISNINEQVVLKEGEHHLVILSDDYRNESRRFVVERAKITDLIIELQDPTPIIIFEAPQNAQIFLNNTQIPQNRGPMTIEPGTHEVKFQVGDYTVTRTINIQRGKTYRVAMAVDITIQEDE